MSDPIGAAMPALDGFHARDERGGDRANARNQYAELSVGRRNLDVVLCWTKLLNSLRCAVPTLTVHARAGRSKDLA